DHTIELRIDVGDQARGSRWRARVARSAGRGLADEKLVEDETEGVDVGPLGQRRTQNALLRCHVGWRAGQPPRTGLGGRNSNTKIGDATRPVVVDENVGGLEIAVKDTLGVGGS